MKFQDFRKLMQKKIFTIAEARVVAFRDKSDLLKLQLHNWKKKGELISLKKGVYVFSDYQPSFSEIAKILYSPCYISLEYVLSFYGLIPEAAFTVTLVTTKTTRRFETPFGVYSYQKIKDPAFTGYNPDSLLAEKEKALVDFCYLKRNQMTADFKFWEEMRLEKENLRNLNFKKIFHFARLFNSQKLMILINNLQNYTVSLEK